MAIGSLEVQIFVSLAVILIAGFIALIVDYLKGANESLRVQNADLRARQEERDWLLEAGLLTHSKQEESVYQEFSYFESAGLPEPEFVRDAEPLPPTEKVAETPTIEPVAAKVAPEQAKEQQDGLAEPPPAAGVLRLPKLEAAQPGGATPARLQPVPVASAANGVLVAKSGLQVEKPVPAEPPELPLIVLPRSEEQEPAWADVRRHADVLRLFDLDGPPAPAEPQWPESPFVMATDEIMGEQENEEQPAGLVSAQPAAMPGPVLVSDTPRRKLEFPVGLHTTETLEALLKEQAKMDGLVLLVGVNNYEKLKSGREAARQAAAESVAALMRTIVSAKGFAAPRDESEYVIVFPGETGAEAYRRVRQVTERLWDYQLRSLAQDAVTFTSFSWGTAEVSGDSLSDAIAAAEEQMNETRRMRSSYLAAGGMRSRAVNL